MTGPPFAAAARGPMTIFVAGATGVLGRPTVRDLIAAGHRVRGVARGAAKADLVRELGAEPVEVDLFDPLALHRAVGDSDAVIHLATRIPPLARARWARAWRENDRLRREGAERLMNAALVAGARVYVQESITFPYADGGERWLYETAPLDVVPLVASALDAERETARLTAAGGRGVVLRFATFYGAEAASTQDTIRLARRGLLPIVGDPQRFMSSIHVDDAARAVVAALDAPAGIYNVADDEPLRFADYVAAVVDAFGCPPPRRLPGWLVPLLAGAAGKLLLRSQRVANKLFTSVTGWAPQYRNAREGWSAIARTLNAAF